MMLYNLFRSIPMALKSISGNKLRAFLTMLGIIIGVMALVILVSLVSGATGTVTDTISQLGTNLLTVSVSDDKGMPIGLDDLEEWTEHDGIGLTAAWQSESAVGKYGADSATVQLYGVTAAYSQIQNINVLIGRYIKTADLDNATNVCVINETAATELVGFTDCLGESISLNGTRYTVAGVMEDDDDSLTAVFGSGSLVVHIPYTSFVRLSSSVTSDIDSFYVSAAESGSIEAAETAINALLLERFEQDEDAFDISTQDALEVHYLHTHAASGRHCGDFTGSGRHRHHEHHACHRHRAHKGDRHQEGHRRQPRHHTSAVSAGERGAVYAGLRCGYLPLLGLSQGGGAGGVQS